MDYSVILSTATSCFNMQSHPILVMHSKRLLTIDNSKFTSIGWFWLPAYLLTTVLTHSQQSTGIINLFSTVLLEQKNQQTSFRQDVLQPYYHKFTSLTIQTVVLLSFWLVRLRVVLYFILYYGRTVLFPFPNPPPPTPKRTHFPSLQTLRHPEVRTWWPQHMVYVPLH